MKENKDFFSLEHTKAQFDSDVEGRITQSFSGFGWKMERMRIGQGKAEGIHKLKNELSGNDFSWNKARVPGDVYTDLCLAGEIDDPHYGRNMAKIKWVQDYEWWYNYAFSVNPGMQGKTITLDFEGVDYSCEVWLNTHYLGRHEGMFSSFSFEVTDIVDMTQNNVPVNLLTVKLDPPPKNQQNIAGAKHNFQGDYLSGIIPFGIWRDVNLVATSSCIINEYRVEYELEGENAKASLEIESEFFNTDLKDVQLVVTYKDGDDVRKFTKDLGAVSKKTNATIEFLLEKPKLWWPYDLGEPFLYDLEIALVHNGEILDNIKERTGVRQVTMAMNPGFTPEEVENPWTFVINGKPMFLRSACWGGQPSFFYGRNSDEKYEHYLRKCKECNINNLRIFGWHPPEVKKFYELCDELGITNWTNFTFATQEFRHDREYLELVEQEIVATVKDRRNHPSMIMFMGGEEVYFTEAHVHSKNRLLMEKVGIMTSKNTNIPYGDASPLSSREGIRMGYAPKESAHANNHYYAAGAIFMEDFYPQLDYAVIPELTAASAPNVESLKKFIPENELWPMGVSWGYHWGDLHVLEILNYEVFGDVKKGSLEEFVEATQIAQGTVAQFSLEHFRRQKPHVSAVALCHFITNFPIIKWDIIDYYGVEKRSFAMVKRAYEPLLPSLEFKKRRYLPKETFEGNLYILNDRYESYEGLTLAYEVISNADKIIESGSVSASAGENVSVKVGDFSFVIPENIGADFKIKLTLSQNNTVLQDNEYTFLIADQEEAKKEAKRMYDKMHEGRHEFGKGYYRYFPEVFRND
ncbi:MAG: glycoside hydrolase family 2 TIM barrel-domain containing protein [Bacillota bacterium]